MYISNKTAATTSDITSTMRELKPEELTLVSGAGVPWRLVISAATFVWDAGYKFGSDLAKR